MITGDATGATCLGCTVECEACNATGPSRPTETAARDAARDVRGFVRVLVAGPFGDVPTDLCPECAALHGKRDARGRLIPAV